MAYRVPSNAAGKPFVLHPGLLLQDAQGSQHHGTRVKMRILTSGDIVDAVGLAYKKGLRKPSGLCRQ